MKLPLTGILALGLVACATNINQIPPPTPKMAMELGVAEAELVRGHASYMQHCQRCHERVPPGKIDPEYWRGIVPHMAANAELGAGEEQDLLLYLIAAHGTVHQADLEH